MTVAELREQIEWMPDDYELIVRVYDYGFDSQIKSDVSLHVSHDEKQILFYGT